jgi:hypothetical protein
VCVAAVARVNYKRETTNDDDDDGMEKGNKDKYEYE